MNLIFLMSTDAPSQSEGIKDKLVKLLNQHKKLQLKCDELAKKNEALRQKCDDVEREVRKLKNDYERLKLAKAFGLSEESKKQAHNRMNKLVRDIESCITILKR